MIYYVRLDFDLVAARRYVGVEATDPTAAARDVLSRVHRTDLQHVYISTIRPDVLRNFEEDPDAV